MLSAEILVEWAHVNAQTRSNSIAWNPMEAFNFTCANEDCSLYTYDMRKLETAACVHKVCCDRIKSTQDPQRHVIS
jgi:hypothetical protein